MQTTSEFASNLKFAECSNSHIIRFILKKYFFIDIEQVFYKFFGGKSLFHFCVVEVHYIFLQE